MGLESDEIRLGAQRGAGEVGRKCRIYEGKKRDRV